MCTCGCREQKSRIGKFLLQLALLLTVAGLCLAAEPAAQGSPVVADSASWKVAGADKPATDTSPPDNANNDQDKDTSPPDNANNDKDVSPPDHANNPGAKYLTPPPNPEDKIAGDLKPTGPGELVDVVVQFAGPPDGTGEPEPKELDLIGASAATVDQAVLQELANNPRVAYITPDRELSPSMDYAAPTVYADLAREYGYSGEDVGIALIDSGVYQHPDLQDSECGSSRVVYRENFVPDSDELDDLYGHGTHVAGIVGGNGHCVAGPDPKARLAGIAPGVHFVSLRVLNRLGIGRDSALIAAIQRAVELKDEYNIRVMNLSLGRPVGESYELDPLGRAVEAAWRAGIVVVAAAGNYGRLNEIGNQGYGTITSPGNHPLVITVGAMKTGTTTARGDDHIASFSSKGPTALDHVVKPDLVAPGNRIISLLSPNSRLAFMARHTGAWVFESYYMSSGGYGMSPHYFRLSGTSMATSMVSGAVALLLEKEPELSPDQVKARLMKTASKIFPGYSVFTDPDTHEAYQNRYDIFTVGAGYLDIRSTLENADVPPPDWNARSPIAVYDSVNDAVSLVPDSSSIWGSSAIWGTLNLRAFDIAEVWGESVFLQGSSALWGSSAVWGSFRRGGSDAIWGESAVWGSLHALPDNSDLRMRGDQ